MAFNNSVSSCLALLQVIWFINWWLPLWHTSQCKWTGIRFFISQIWPNLSLLNTRIFQPLVTKRYWNSFVCLFLQLKDVRTSRRLRRVVSSLLMEGLCWDSSVIRATSRLLRQWSTVSTDSIGMERLLFVKVTLLIICFPTFVYRPCSFFADLRGLSQP